MVASSNPRWLQWAFTTLVGLFDRVGLKTNTGKTVDLDQRSYRKGAEGGANNISDRVPQGGG